MDCYESTHASLNKTVHITPIITCIPRHCRTHMLVYVALPRIHVAKFITRTQMCLLCQVGIAASLIYHFVCHSGIAAHLFCCFHSGIAAHFLHAR